MLALPKGPTVINSRFAESRPFRHVFLPLQLQGTEFITSFFDNKRTLRLIFFKIWKRKYPTPKKKKPQTKSPNKPLNKLHTEEHFTLFWKEPGYIYISWICLLLLQMQRSEKINSGKRIAKEKFSHILNKQEASLPNSFVIYPCPADGLRVATTNATYWPIKTWLMRCNCNWRPMHVAMCIGHLLYLCIL